MLDYPRAEGDFVARLIIKNFLHFKDVSFEAGDITVFIGPQAQGKSILAKLLYFFENLYQITEAAVFDQGGIRTVSKAMVSSFEESFPRYTWEKTDFSITYTEGNLEVKVEGVFAKLKTKLTVTLCEEFKKRLSRLNSSNQKKIFSVHESVPVFRAAEISWSEREETAKEVSKLFYEMTNRLAARSVFIPAGRSFFSLLQKNVFAFLADNLSIDPFIKRFGRSYEAAKDIYNVLGRQGRDKGVGPTRLSIEEGEKIINGEYQKDKQGDWILDPKRKIRINISNCSSGQQEALPLVTILCTLPFVSLAGDGGGHFIIEEPEAHLFPEAQLQIMNMIAMAYNNKSASMKRVGSAGRMQNRFVVTTHSPYVLSALNNAMLGCDLYENPAAREAAEKFINKNFIIPKRSVRAYVVRNGRVDLIQDSENGLIGQSAIDSASEVIAEQFGQLLEVSCQYSDEAENGGR